MKFVKWFAYLLVGAVALAFAYLLVMPPELLRVGTNYTAKMVCSNVVLANRNPDEVLAVDVQAPGHPLLRLMRLNISKFEGTTIVRAGLLGVIAEGAAAGNTSSGCTNMPASMSDEQLFKAQMVPNRFAPAQTQLSADLQWPQGSAVDLEDNEQLNAILNDTQLVGPGMRAVVIVKDGRIIAERYGEGFNAETPLVGWSITKTVTAALIGRAVREGHMTLDDPIESFDWSGDERGQVRFTDLMGMASNLEWNESYGSVSDVTRMLFLENDMAGFVAAQPIDADQPNAIGKVFNYSSGTTVLLSRIWQDAIGNEVDAVAFPTKALFEPLGMTSAVKEMDASGTYVGSSYMYATARDWARFGQFMLQRGVLNGRSLLPIGYVDWMTKPHSAAPDGEYGNGQVWLRPANAWILGSNPKLPADAFFMNGHDGQSINVVPSEGLVVVRLGLTPTRRMYKVANLVEAVIEATRD